MQCHGMAKLSVMGGLQIASKGIQASSLKPRNALQRVTIVCRSFMWLLYGIYAEVGEPFSAGRCVFVNAWGGIDGLLLHLNELLGIRRDCHKVKRLP